MAPVWHQTDIPTTASIRPLGAVAHLSWNNRVAPRAGLEPAAYCLGGKPEPGQTTPTAALHGADLQRQSPDAA
jgi:hypothetical protein